MATIPYGPQRPATGPVSVLDDEQPADWWEESRRRAGVTGPARQLAPGPGGGFKLPRGSTGYDPRDLTAASVDWTASQPDRAPMRAIVNGQEYVMRQRERSPEAAVALKMLDQKREERLSREQQEKKAADDAQARALKIEDEQRALRMEDEKFKRQLARDKMQEMQRQELDPNRGFNDMKRNIETQELQRKGSDLEPPTYEDRLSAIDAVKGDQQAMRQFGPMIQAARTRGELKELMLKAAMVQSEKPMGSAVAAASQSAEAVAQKYAAPLKEAAQANDVERMQMLLNDMRQSIADEIMQAGEPVDEAKIQDLVQRNLNLMGLQPGSSMATRIMNIAGRLVPGPAGLFMRDIEDPRSEEMLRLLRGQTQTLR